MDEVSSVESLAIPKRQKVFDKTFLPAGDALPVWSTMSLDSKLPVPPSPRDSYTLYTNKVGEPKYINSQKYDFDLTNPQGREAPGDYDSLNDPSLKTYFRSPRTRQHLVDSGLITDRGEIKCSVKDFNQYREFVRYRSVTELSLQKKKEMRVKQESMDRLFLEWPNVHKKTRRGKVRLTQSEPTHKDWRLDGLEMYRENLALALRKREELTKKREEEKYSRRGERSRKSHELFSPGPKSYGRSPRMHSPDKSPRQVYSPDKSPRHLLSPEKTPRGHMSDRGGGTSADSLASTQMFSPRGTTLVDDMRRREQELNKRLDEQRKQRIEDHKKKIEENWKERHHRQERLLQHEAEVEAKVKDERVQHILDREKTLVQQRKKQEEKLRKIKQELSKPNKYGMKEKYASSFKGDSPEKGRNSQESGKTPDKGKPLDESGGKDSPGKSIGNTPDNHE